jgi:hypothetical protein
MLHRDSSWRSQRTSALPPFQPALAQPLAARTVGLASRPLGMQGLSAMSVEIFYCPT